MLNSLSTHDAALFLCGAALVIAALLGYIAAAVADIARDLSAMRHRGGRF